jgi:hypothetical protein
MIRNSMRSTRLLSWRCLRWAIAIPTLPLIWWACTSHPLAQPVPQPEMQTDIYISVSPTRLLDLVFMVDNSPSMAPKVAKMNAQLQKLIAALEDPNDNNSLPDLRVAVIDSDLGTGAHYSEGACGPKTWADGSTGHNYGDQGRFQMIQTPDNCGANSDAIFLEYKKGAAVNYTGDINNVFACLAKNLGTNGCGEEHQLQAYEFALAAQGVGNEEQQKAFLRGNAYLGLVFLTDEDDCSAATNDGMFGDMPDLRTESASLRCATRAHMCGGKNLTETPPGYKTTANFEAAFSDCEARTDACPNPTDGNGETDTSVATNCSPLKGVSRLANEIKGLKPNDPDQILVAGIFGWPLNDNEMAKARYKIAPIPNPNTADKLNPTVFDYWPVCYDPDHMPAPATTDAATGFDQTAAGIGAYGGLRLSAFVDEFGENGLKFSICQTDFSASMKVIGDAIAKKLQNLCVDYKLMDKDGDATNGLQPDCRVVYRTPYTDPKDPTKTLYEESPISLPPCPAGATAGHVDTDCWQLTNDPKKCEKNGQLINVLRTAKEIADGPLIAGTKVGMQCRTCIDTLVGQKPVKGCE